MDNSFYTEKKSFLVYKDWQEYLIALGSDEAVGRLFKALCVYAFTGEPPILGEDIKMVFLFMKNTIDRDGKKWEKVCAARSAAGKKGGRPKKSISETKEQN